MSQAPEGGGGGTSLLRIGVYVIGGLTVAGFLWSSLNAEYTAKTLKAEYVRSRAIKRKKKGNRAFVKGDYAIATKHYSKALEFDPDRSVLLLNRAGNLQSCLRDCNRVLMLYEGRKMRDPITSRCYSVIVKALIGLGLNTEANDVGRYAQHYQPQKQTQEESQAEGGNEELPYWPLPVSLLSTEKGKVLIAKQDFNAGDIVFTECAFANTVTRDQTSNYCDFCLHSLNSDEKEREQCLCCTGVYYCSPVCQTRAWMHHHRLLCRKDRVLSDEILEEMEKEEEALEFLAKRREERAKEKEKNTDESADHPKETDLEKQSRQKESPVLLFERNCKENQEITFLVARGLARLAQQGNSEYTSEYYGCLASLPGCQEGPSIEALEPLRVLFQPTLKEFDSVAPCLLDKALMNCIAIPSSNETSLVKGKGLYLAAGFLGTSTSTNVSCSFVNNNDQISIVAQKDIKAGEELIAFLSVQG